MDGFHPQELANTAWAFATVDLKDISLFTALAIAAERRMDGFNHQQITNAAWAFATMGQTDAVLLFAALSAAAE